VTVGQAAGRSGRDSLRRYEEGVGTDWYTKHIGAATGAGGQNRIEDMYEQLKKFYPIDRISAVVMRKEIAPTLHCCGCAAKAHHWECRSIPFHLKTWEHTTRLFMTNAAGLEDGAINHGRPTIIRMISKDDQHEDKTIGMAGH
jgi:hypothetical protein